MNSKTASRQLQGTWHQDLIQSQPFELQQLPDLWVDGRREVLGNLAYLDYDLDAVNYWRQRGISGGRQFESSRSRCRGVSAIMSMASLLGLMGQHVRCLRTRADVIPVGKPRRFEPTGTKFQNLILQQFSRVRSARRSGLQRAMDSVRQDRITTELERVYDVDWKYVDKLKHTVEPFVNYDYVPDISQSGVPLFDERDRINARSLIVYGFTSRLYGKMNSPTDTSEVRRKCRCSIRRGAIRGCRPTVPGRPHRRRRCLRYHQFG